MFFAWPLIKSRILAILAKTPNLWLAESLKINYHKNIAKTFDYKLRPHFQFATPNHTPQSDPNNH